MKKLKYKRVIYVSMIVLCLISMSIYLFINRSHIHEYNGNIKTYVGTYRQDNKVYTFDLKGFYAHDQYYVSLNDMYNVVVIMDKEATVFLHPDKHLLKYKMRDGEYCFDYGYHKIVYNNDCIDLKKNRDYIYVSHKNIYISVSLIEKIILKNEKKIKIEDANAIIE